MADRILRDEDGAAVLDADDDVVAELELDRVDSLADRAETVAELAAGARSWRFGHVIVDEAQDLTPMQWRMVARRARGGSMTIVGDLAQRSIGEPGTWAEHLPESIADFTYRELTVNYRSPAEVNDLAAAVLAELAPQLTASRSIRTSGHVPEAIAVDALSTSTLKRIVERERAAIDRGKLAIIGLDLPSLDDPEGDNVSWLSPWQAKGLEFDSVIVVEPARLLDEPHGLSLLFVALTRTTGRLTIVHERPLPNVLVGVLGEGVHLQSGRA